MSARGLFVGLATLDLVYQVEAVPQPNQKIVAIDSAIAAGGPATNAAVTFRHLGQPQGNQATVAAAVGSHALSRLILSDLEACSVAVVDLTPERREPPPTSSVLVTQTTGDRAVVSPNAVRRQAPADRLPVSLVEAAAIVLIDGHQLEAGRAAAQRARALGIPVVLDGGSWKSGLEQILPAVDYAICSANFYPPGCDTAADVFACLSAIGVPHAAISQGAQPVRYLSQGVAGEVAVPSITPVDTLGAGDVLHGAFCHYVLGTAFPAALAAAVAVASRSCQSFGTRAWIGC